MIDFNGFLTIVWITLLFHRAVSAFCSPVACKCLFKIISVDSIIRTNIFHCFTGRAFISIGVAFIQKLIRAEGFFIPRGFVLLTIELVMFHISGYFLFLQPLIILLAAVTCISCN